MTSELHEIVQRARDGERRWLARAITHIELRTPGIGALIEAESVRRRKAPGVPHVIGITGPPGAGKSSLVDRLIALAREDAKQVAVVAVDPSSPFTGGAILGDRVRMEVHSEDDGVYIRSMSSRGHLGGLSSATAEVVDLLDAAGFDLILVETVGVGQSELGVMEVADTVVLVLTPESGDTVQTMKAGFLEIADVFVVNKADRPGADRLVLDLEQMVALASKEGSWVAPVHATSVVQGRGLDLVLTAASAHLAWCEKPGIAWWHRRRGDALVRLYLDLVAEEARNNARQRLTDRLESDLRSGRISPHDAAGRSR